MATIIAARAARTVLIDPAFRPVAGDPVPDWLVPTLPGVARIPAGQVAVVGDNPRSQDSRQLGLVDCHDILGAVPRT